MSAGNLAFKDLVQRVHSTVASALAHANVPQMQVIAELARSQQLLAFNAIPYQARPFHMCPGSIMGSVLHTGITKGCDLCPGNNTCMHINTDICVKLW